MYLTIKRLFKYVFNEYPNYVLYAFMYSCIHVFMWIIVELFNSFLISEQILAWSISMSIPLNSLILNSQYSIS